MIKRIGVLTSGGDAPGMNAAVRAVVRTAINNGLEVFAIYEGYKGMYENNIVQMDRKSVSEKIDRGGTFIYTARLPEFKNIEIREVAVENLKKNGIEAVVVIGGDGSYMGALKLTEMGINCIAIPGTIDNDIASTDFTIGFDTALNTIVENIDRLRDTSMSHKRCSIIEVMGRYCGDLALHSGIATGAEYVLTPENDFDIDEIIADLKINFRNKRHLILTVAENLLDVNALAKRISEEVNIEARATVLGHIQRGGNPSANDRILASRMGIKSVELLLSGVGGQCVCIIKNEIISKPIEEALKEKRDKSSVMFGEIKNLR